MYSKIMRLGILLGLFCLFTAGCTPVIPEEIRRDVSSPVSFADEETIARRTAVQEIVNSSTSGLPFRYYAEWRTADWICADDAAKRCAARSLFEAFDQDGYTALLEYGDPDYLNHALDGYTEAMDRFFSETHGAYRLQDFVDVNRQAAEPAEEQPAPETEENDA